jgi:hypothetical protein
MHAPTLTRRDPVHNQARRSGGDDVTEPQHRSTGKHQPRAPRTEAAPTPEPEATATPALPGLAVRRAFLPGVPSAGAIEAAVGSRAQGAAGRLPQRNQLESAVGHDMSGVVAHAGGAAAGQIGAQAFATGRDIALGGATAATVPHEAAHIVQQRAGVGQAIPEAGIASVLEQDNAAVIGHPAPRADAQR